MPDRKAHNVLHPTLKTLSFKSRGMRIRGAYDVGPGKRFTPAHEEWIWKTSGACRRLTLN